MLRTKLFSLFGSNNLPFKVGDGPFLRVVSDFTRKIVFLDQKFVHYNVPPSANKLPRPAGISSMYRLPVVSSTKGV